MIAHVKTTAVNLLAQVVLLLSLPGWLALSGEALSPNDPLRKHQYGLDLIHAEQAWSKAKGAGVVVAILDTGVDLQHEDLRDQIVRGHDFITGNEIPDDRNGHGTHVAGIVAAATDNGIGVAGVAPSARILPLRVLDAKGAGLESNVVLAIDFALERAKTLGLKLVINMSFTELSAAPAIDSDALRQALQRAWSAGAVIVAAAGNRALPFSEYPAAGPNVLAVGAINAAGERVSSSNQRVTVVAPGDNILSTYWDPATPNDHHAYSYGSGTSMASAFVAGVAALCLSSGLNNRQTVDKIIRTADPLGSGRPNSDFGYGRVNAARAVGIGTAWVAPDESAREPAWRAIALIAIALLLAAVLGVFFLLPHWGRAGRG